MIRSFAVRMISGMAAEQYQNEEGLIYLAVTKNNYTMVLNNAQKELDQVELRRLVFE